MIPNTGTGYGTRSLIMAQDCQQGFVNVIILCPSDLNCICPYISNTVPVHITMAHPVLADESTAGVGSDSNYRMGEILGDQPPWVSLSNRGASYLGSTGSAHRWIYLLDLDHPCTTLMPRCDALAPALDCQCSPTEQAGGLPSEII